MTVGTSVGVYLVFDTMGPRTEVDKDLRDDSGVV